MSAIPPKVLAASLAAAAFAAVVGRDALAKPKTRASDAARTEAAMEQPIEHRRRNWIGVHVQQDLAYIEQETGVCAPGTQTSGRWVCVRQDSQTQYHGTPIRERAGDIPKSGLDAATTRLLLSYDRVLGSNFTLGARVGYVVQGRGPRPDGAEAKESLAWHAAGRFAYWFGTDPFTRSGFRPFVFGSVGLAQMDSKFVVAVREDRSVPPPPQQLRNPDQQQLDAWHRSGRLMLGIGGGLVYALTPALGIAGEIGWMQLVPTAGVGVSFRLGLVFGF